MVKNKLKYGLSWSVLLSTTSTRHYSFPIFSYFLFSYFHYSFPNIFSYCFCMLSEFAKVFERKVWRVQVVICISNAARALSSLSRCFELSENLDKNSFRYLWYCGKEQIECRLAWHWWNLHVLHQSECRNCCLYIIIQKIAPQAESGKYFQIWFFRSFFHLGRKWRRSELAHASYTGLSFRPRGFSPYMGREERRVQGLK